VGRELFHIDLNGQKSIKYDQDLVFGHVTCSPPSAPSTCWSTASRAGGPRYDGPVHFDYKPSRTEDFEGVWASAAANMSTYILLAERAKAFRATPRCSGARASGVYELATPTLGEGETLTDLLADRRPPRSSTSRRSPSAASTSCGSTSSRSSTPWRR